MFICIIVVVDIMAPGPKMLKYNDISQFQVDNLSRESNGRVFRIAPGRLEETKASVIICPNSTNFKPLTEGATGAVMKKSGREPFEEVEDGIRQQMQQGHITKHSVVPAGAVIWSGPGKLCNNSVESIAHVIYPTREDARSDPVIRSETFSLESMAIALDAALFGADRDGKTSVALPLLGAGHAGLGKDEAFETIFKIATNFLDKRAKSITEVILVVLPDKFNLILAYLNDATTN
ncbi:Uncharacterised protein [uncultured archaeon]|nr:Uncharacterised protein [uncultured archaeon]